MRFAVPHSSSSLHFTSNKDPVEAIREPGERDHMVQEPKGGCMNVGPAKEDSNVSLQDGYLFRSKQY